MYNCAEETLGINLIEELRCYKIKVFVYDFYESQLESYVQSQP